MAERIDDVACTVCGCVCDDLRVTVEAGRVVHAEGACTLAEPWYQSLGLRKPPVAEIDGRSATLEAALDRAATLLREARAPLIYGLSRSTTDGQRGAVALADRLRATIDTTASLGHAPSVLALQTVGESTCTLGEVKNRADLVIFWGCDPLVSHPRHWERYSVAPVGVFVNGRAHRTVVVADIQQTATSGFADVFLPITPGCDFEVLWTLRGLVRGVEPAADTTVGAPLDVLRDLAERMKRCRFGIVFFGLGLGRNGPRTVEALLRLVTDLNDFTRFYVRRMRVPGDVAGADSVLAWQTGYPFSVNFGPGHPRYNPGEFTAQDVLIRGEADVCLLVGSGGVRRFSPEGVAALERTPTIALDGPQDESLGKPLVRFTTAVPGVHVAGTAYRMDEVPIRLRPILPKEYASDAEILDGILARL